MKKEIIRVELYKTFYKDNSIDKLFEKNGYQVTQYSFFSEEKKRFISKNEYIAREFICLLKLFFKIKDFRNKKIFCLGGYYSTLLICRIFSFLLGKHFQLYIYNFYLHEAGEKKIVKRILRFLLNNKKLELIVQSPEEISYYQSLANIPIHFVPYCSDLKEKKMEQHDFSHEYIFTGGYTNRDYSLMIECAESMPELRFVFVISHLNNDIVKEELPDNITVYKNITQMMFDTLVAHADIVIIPLKKDVGSSGQMLCINAMQNKKPIIYSDVSSINYYFTKESGIPYKINNLHSLKEGIKKLIDNPDSKVSFGEKAFQNFYSNFTNKNRDQAIFNIINKS